MPNFAGVKRELAKEINEEPEEEEETEYERTYLKIATLMLFVTNCLQVVRGCFVKTKGLSFPVSPSQEVFSPERPLPLNKVVSSLLSAMFRSCKL